MERVSPTHFRSKLDLQHLFHEGRTGYRLEDEIYLPPRPIKKRTLSQLSALDEKASDAPPIQSRKLPPIQSAAPQDVPQRAPSLHSVLPPPSSTLPETRLSKPFGFENLLNPIDGNKTSASGRQHDGERTDSLRAAPMAAMSRPSTPSLPSISKRRDSLGDITMPSISPALMETYPPLLSTSLTLGSRTSCGPGLITTGLSTATVDTRQSPFVLPRDQASASVGLGPLLPSETASEKGFNAPTSGAPGQSQYRTMIFETVYGPIQVPVDVQAASKVADEKRKRNATASHGFRQRRKEKEQETADNISRLEAEVKYYQLERDFLQGVLQENHIPIPPRAPSPRRRHTSLEGPQHQDTAASARNEGRNNRRRTNAYVPPQWLPSQTVEAPLPMPPFKHMTTMSSEHMQVLKRRACP